MCTASKHLHRYSERFVDSEWMYLGVFRAFVHGFSGPPLYTMRIRNWFAVWGMFLKNKCNHKKRCLGSSITTFHLHQKQRFGCKKNNLSFNLHFIDPIYQLLCFQRWSPISLNSEDINEFVFSETGWVQRGQACPGSRGSSCSFWLEFWDSLPWLSLWLNWAVLQLTPTPT